MIFREHKPRSLTAYWLLAVVLTGCNLNTSPSLRGSGVAKSEERETPGFTGISIANAIQLDFETGPASGLTVVADDNILPHVKTEVSGDSLEIYVDTAYTSEIGVKVRASAPALRAFQGSGASKAELTDIAGDEFALELSGASKCELSGQLESIDVEVSGASKVVLAGTAKRVTIDSSGASRVEARGLVADAIEAELSGASTADLNVTEKLIVDASGASSLRYVGQPAQVEKELSGASTMTAQEPVKAEKE